jgi:hypothetical protein
VDRPVPIPQVPTPAPGWFGFHYQSGTRTRVRRNRTCEGEELERDEGALPVGRRLISCRAAVSACAPARRAPVVLPATSRMGS